MDKLLILWYLLQLRLARPLRKSAWGLRVLRKRKLGGFRQNLSRSDFYRPLAETPVAEMPLMNKARYLANFDAINTVGVTLDEALDVARRAEETRDFSPMIGELSVGLSSGTSGTKGVFLTSRRERARWVACIVDRVLGFSLRPRRVAFFLRANNGLYESVNSRLVTFDFYDLLEPIDRLFERLAARPADILIAQSSVLDRLARRFAERPQVTRPQRVIAVAEVLEDDVALRVERMLGCRVEQVYQATEGFLAHTCSAGRLHLNEDWLIVERKPVGPGRYHPVITDLWRRSQPMVHYELNDILHEGDACTCGLASAVIARIEGRADDVMVFAKAKRGTGLADDGKATIFPDFLRRAIMLSSDRILNYELARTGETTLSLYLETAPDDRDDAYAAAELALSELFGSHGLTGLPLHRHDAPSQAPGAKLKRIRNDYSTAV